MSNKKMRYVIWIDGKKAFAVYEMNDAWDIFEQAVEGYGENRVGISVEYV